MPTADASAPLAAPSLAPILILALVALTAVTVIGYVLLEILAPGAATSATGRIATVVVPVVGIIMTMLRGEANARQNAADTREVHLSVNSRLDQMMTAETKVARQEGFGIGLATDAMVPGSMAAGQVSMDAAGDKAAAAQAAAGAHVADQIAGRDPVTVRPA
jgi:hypothetical protein